MPSEERRPGRGLMRLHNCESCRIRAYAERKPESIIARIWTWHAGWCPLFKAEQRKQAEKQEAEPPH